MVEWLTERLVEVHVVVGDVLLHAVLMLLLLTAMLFLLLLLPHGTGNKTGHVSAKFTRKHADRLPYPILGDTCIFRNVFRFGC